MKNTTDQPTCSEAHKRPSHEHVVLVLGRWQTHVRVVDVGRDIDKYGADQRLSAGPVIGPEAKKGRGHHLTQTIGCHHPAKKTGICSGINLGEQMERDFFYMSREFA